MLKVLSKIWGAVRLRINFWQEGWAPTDEIDRIHLSGENLRMDRLVFTPVIPGRDPVRVSSLSRVVATLHPRVASCCNVAPTSCELALLEFKQTSNKLLILLYHWPHQNRLSIRNSYLINSRILAGYQINEIIDFLVYVTSGDWNKTKIEKIICLSAYLFEIYANKKNRLFVISIAKFDLNKNKYQACSRTTRQMAADHQWSADHRLRTAELDQRYRRSHR